MTMGDELRGTPTNYDDKHADDIVPYWTVQAGLSEHGRWRQFSGHNVGSGWHGMTCLGNTARLEMRCRRIGIMSFTLFRYFRRHLLDLDGRGVVKHNSGLPVQGTRLARTMW
jgi:hypothetical protein